jgi:Flp pilus assembly protein TadD
MATVAELLAQGQQHLQNGAPRRAEAVFRQVLQEEPSNLRALNLLGSVCQLLGQSEEALAVHREALRLEPRQPHVHYNVALLLLQQGQFVDAAHHARQALEQRPDYAGPHNILGQVLHQQGRSGEALAAFTKAAQLDPNSPDPHNNLGSVHRHEGRFEEAAASFRRALRLKPDHPEAHHNLALALFGLEQHEEARDHVLEALRLRPQYGQAYYSLFTLVKRGLCEFKPADIERMQAIATSDRLSPDDRSHLNFTLAEWFDQQDDPDTAFSYFRQGNEWRKKHFAQHGGIFQAVRHRRYIDAIIAAFDRPYFERARGLGVDSEQPVFIVGMPRSGTSLVEQILASHPEVYGAGELMDITRIVESLPGRLQNKTGFPQCMASLDRDTIQAVAQRYLQALSEKGGSARRITDKMPDNFLYLGVIRTLFPKARIIHCRRETLDVCVSCYLQNFTFIRYATALVDIAVYYRQYERLMAHWHTALPGELCEVPYEELVRHQEAVSRELVEHCGLPWDERCLAFHDNPRTVQTASKDQVRRPMYRSSIGRWKRYANHLQPLIDTLAGNKP